ncbi:DUF2842 domain-containing protein [Roseomonas aeriglobus]|nr:DUF2842 domain-containing protein [Roseomonas aeriglobus]
MTPSWRKPAGALGILAWIAFWVVLITSFSHVIGGWPVLVQAVVYLVAGIVWILPLRPVLQWMETGSVHPPRD